MLFSSCARRKSHGGAGLAAFFATIALLGTTAAHAAGTTSATASATVTVASGNPAVAFRPELTRFGIERDPADGGWRLAPLSGGGLPGQDLDLALNQSSEGLFTEMLPQGGYRMNLQGRFQNYAVAHKDLRGAVHYDCGEDAISLYQWLLDVPAEVDAMGRPTR